MIDRPLVSVVIPTKNRAASLRNALEALRQQDYPDYEVVVVDNGSTDSTPQVAAEYGVRFLVNREFGVSLTRQYGVDAARGEIIAMCDDDSVPDEKWITSLVRRLRAEDDLGLIGGLIIPIGFDQDKGKGIIGRNGVMTFVDDPYLADYFASSNVGFRRAAVQAIGGYDPFFRTGGYEEPDLIFRIKAGGFRVDYEPSAIAKHVNPGVSYRKGHLFYDGQLMRVYFYLKHYRPNSARDWVGFLGYEMKLIRQELGGMPYELFDATRRRQFRRWRKAGLAVFNSLSARLAIPWLLWKIHQRSHQEKRANA